MLKHTLEVVHLAGIMAAELRGERQDGASARALLHDLGKALTHEVEGSHALISAQYARRYGESPRGRARDRGAPLRGRAADGRGGAADRRRRDLRLAPGRARREPRALHQAARGARGARAAQHDGVEKVYALQAGREIRGDRQAARRSTTTAAVLLSHEIAREIEDQLEYPGQIKVTVIRESRAIGFAK